MIGQVFAEASLCTSECIRFFHRSLYSPRDKTMRASTVSLRTLVLYIQAAEILRCEIWLLAYCIYKGLDIITWESRNHISVWWLASVVTQWPSAYWLSSHELAYFSSLLCLSFLLKAPAGLEFLSPPNLDLSPLLLHRSLSIQLPYTMSQFSFLRAILDHIGSATFPLMIGHFLVIRPGA